MIAHSFLRSLSQNLLLANWLRSLFGFLHPHTLAKLCSVFKVLPLSDLLHQKAFILYQIRLSFVKNFFEFIFAFKFLTWRQLNILPEVFISCKLFLKYFLFLFACLLLFRFLSKATLLIYLIWKELSTSFWQEIKKRPRLTQSSFNSFLLQIRSGCQTRTDDILINSQALYQLS